MFLIVSTTRSGIMIPLEYYLAILPIIIFTTMAMRMMMAAAMSLMSTPVTTATVIIMTKIIPS